VFCESPNAQNLGKRVFEWLTRLCAAQLTADYGNIYCWEKKYAFIVALAVALTVAV